QRRLARQVMVVGIQAAAGLQDRIGPQHRRVVAVLVAQRDSEDSLPGELHLLVCDEATIALVGQGCSERIDEPEPSVCFLQQDSTTIRRDRSGIKHRSKMPTTGKWKLRRR